MITKGDYVSLSAHQTQLKHIISNLKQLSPSKLQEVEHFVEFTKYNSQTKEIVHSSLSVSEKVLKSIWDNSDDAIYDKL